MPTAPDDRELPRSGSLPQCVALKASRLNDDLTAWQRMFSASFGAFATSFFVTPFDVVRIRLQGQVRTPPGAAGSVEPSVPAVGGAAAEAACECPTHTPAPRQPKWIRVHAGAAEVWCIRCNYFPTTGLPATAAAASTGSVAASLPAKPPPQQFTGNWDAVVKLVRHEGPGSLWRGLSPALLMSVPNTAVYFTAYDQMKQFAEQRMGIDSSVSPLYAGMLSRTLSSSLVSPIELVRTKVQHGNHKAGTLQMIREELAGPQGFRGLFRGLGPTLLRDVPFSGIYWLLLEKIRLGILERMAGGEAQPKAHMRRDLLCASFLSGALAGSVAAVMTHPFDLIKTRRQIDLYDLAEEEAAAGAAQAQRAPPVTTAQVWRTIVAQEGYRGLYTGLGARIGKIAPACAVMISTYEAAKSYFSRKASGELSADDCF